MRKFIGAFMTYILTWIRFLDQISSVSRSTAFQKLWLCVNF